MTQPLPGLTPNQPWTTNQSVNPLKISIVRQDLLADSIERHRRSRWISLPEQVRGKLDLEEGCALVDRSRN